MEVRMKVRFLGLGVAAAFLLAFVVAPAALASSSTAHAAPRVATTTSTSTNSQLIVPITGSDTAGDTFTGTFTVQRFVKLGQNLGAAGVLNGTITNALGQTIGTVTNAPATLPVSQNDPSCTILTLNLGPLDLNLLGLMIHLNQVVLTITAQQGPGNLLGNLLCAVANLLNGGGPLSALTGLLNQIVSILNGL